MTLIEEFRAWYSGYVTAIDDLEVKPDEGPAAAREDSGVPVPLARAVLRTARYRMGRAGLGSPQGRL